MMTFTLNMFKGEESFPFFIQNGSHDEPLCEHDHSDFTELVIVTSGSARHIVNGESDRIGKGDVFVINSGMSHAYEDVHRLRLYNIMFSPKLLPLSDISECDGFKAMFVPSGRQSGFISHLNLDPDELEQITSLILQLQKEYAEKRIGWKTAVQCYLWNIIILLSRLYDFERTKNSEGVERIAGAADYIKQNYAESLSVARLAEMSNYSERQFIRLFKKAFGCIPTEYITNLRMLKAREMLRAKNHSVTEIATFCGYSDGNYFSRIFRKYNGMTPTEYRSMF